MHSLLQGTAGLLFFSSSKKGSSSKAMQRENKQQAKWPWKTNMRRIANIVLMTCALTVLVLPMFGGAQPARKGEGLDPKLVAQTVAVTNSSAAQAGPLGSGDGRIHIIPTLSVPSVKNGDKLSIQAVVKATAPIVKVEARVFRESSDTATAPSSIVTLHPAPGNLGGVNAAGTLGLWQAE
jgi:hypothetical protein